MLLLGFISIIAAIAEALCAEREREREMNLDCFIGIFSAFNFRF
jgi:hypothetical protein